MNHCQMESLLYFCGKIKTNKYLVSQTKHRKWNQQSVIWKKMAKDLELSERFPTFVIRNTGATAPHEHFNTRCHIYQG